MGGRRIIAKASHAVALLAVALFSLASVQSIQMQAGMASPAKSMPMCGATAQSHSAHRDRAPTPKGHANCEFCAAAGHAPICAAAVAVTPSSSVAWASYVLGRPVGSRGPPAITPKSRGPPLIALTV
jgi:hypothetical protein